MAFWLCEAASSEEEQDWLTQGYIGCGSEGVPMNLNDYDNAADLTYYFEEVCGLEDREAQTLTASCWPFAYEMQLGDIVILENLENSTLHVGTVTGQYQCDEQRSARKDQRRTINWYDFTLERSQLPQELKSSLQEFQSRDLSRLSLEQEESFSQYLNSSWQQNHAASMVTSALTREQLVILQLKSKLASGELKLSEVMTQLIEARGLNVAEVHEASAKNLTLISTSPAQVLWQVRSAEQPVTVQVLDYLNGLIPLYQSQHVMLVSLSGFAPELKTAVEPGKLSYQVVLWGPDEIAAMLLSLREHLSAPLCAALALG